MFFKKLAASALAALTVVAGVAHAPQADAAPFRFSTQVTTCSDEFLIAIPGGTNTVSWLPETAPVGPMVTDVAHRVKARTAGRVQPVWVPYAAAPFALMPYQVSERAGFDAANASIRRLAAMCPNAKFSITGYSEGAGIGAMIIRDIAYDRGPIPASRFSSAALLSNPRMGNNGAVYAGGSVASTRGALGGVEGGYGKLGGKVMEYCNPSDPICSLPAIAESAVDPLMRTVVLRGQLPIMELMALFGPNLLQAIPAFWSIRNHMHYNAPAWDTMAGFIVARS